MPSFHPLASLQHLQIPLTFQTFQCQLFFFFNSSSKSRVISKIPWYMLWDLAWHLSCAAITVNRPTLPCEHEVSLSEFLFQHNAWHSGLHVKNGQELLAGGSKSQAFIIVRSWVNLRGGGHTLVFSVGSIPALTSPKVDGSCAFRQASCNLWTVTAKLTYFIHNHQRGLKFEKRVISNTFFRRWFVNRTNKYDLKHTLQRLVKWIEIVFLHYKPLLTLQKAEIQNYFLLHSTALASSISSHDSQ